MLADQDQGQKLRLFFLLSFILIFFLVTLKASETPTIRSTEDDLNDKLDLVSSALKSLTQQSSEMLEILTTFHSENLTSQIPSFPNTAKALNTKISDLKNLLNS